MHITSVSLPDRQFGQQGLVAHVDLGARDESSGNDVATSAAERKPTKKEKRQLRHNLLTEDLGSSQAPYSKSHARRMKRKARESLVADFSDIQIVLSNLDSSSSQAIEQKPNEMQPRDPQKDRKPGQIGEGKGRPLSNSQRQRALATERMRHPLILSNPAFSAEPFKALRTHLQNTLITHDSQ